MNLISSLVCIAIIIVNSGRSVLNENICDGFFLNKDLWQEVIKEL